MDLSRRLRIAHIIGNLETGGSQRLLLEVMRRLDRSRFEPAIIYLKSPNHFAEEIERREWPCQKVAVTRSYRVRELWRLSTALRESSPTIVHAWSDFACFAGRAAGILARAPHLVAHYQNTYAHRFNEPFRRMESLLAARTDSYIACSKGVAQFMGESLDLAGRPVFQLPNCVDLEPFTTAAAHRQEARQQLGIPEGQFHIVHTARLEPHKQPEQLLQALAMAASDGDRSLGDWRATFVGGGSQRDHLELTLKRLDADVLRAGGESILPRVHFVGWSSGVARWLASADVFCLVSRNEGLPLSLVEAMATGVPTIATRTIGPIEVLGEDEHGLLVDSAKPGEILAALLRYRRDEPFRQQMIERGRARAQEYCIDKYVARLSAFYESLAANRGPNRPAQDPFLSRLALLFRLHRTARQGRHAPAGPDAAHEP